MTTDETNLKDSDFIRPAERKYPYRQDGRISINLIKASIVRTAQDGDTKANLEARELLDENS